MNLRARVESNIRDHGLIGKNAALLIGVSGGVDSVVLLHLLQELASEHGWALAVAHFNHCLRGAESDADERFVRDAATGLKLPFYSESGGVQAFARKNSLSIEMAARELRHRFLLRTARVSRLSHIALAHHADDQVETFWLRLLRGDAGPGLAGIRWKRSAASGSEITIVRPLLNIPKADLAAFASEKGLAFRQDASNLDPAFLRNRLRLELFPALQSFQPAFGELTLRAAEVLGAEKAFLESEARRWLAGRERPFAEIHPALQREVIRLQIVQLGAKPDFQLIEELRLAPDRPVSVSPGAQLIRTAAGEITPAESRRFSFSARELPLELNEEGRVAFAGIELQWKIVSSRGDRAIGTEFFDADTIGNSITIRHWSPGDRYQPIGLSRESKLQDIFTNLKLGADEKRRRILAVGTDGKIFWVEGLRISEAHKIQAGTRRIVEWRWRQPEGEPPS